MIPPFLQRAQSELAAHQKKILNVDNHIGISIAGLTADARLLWSVHMAAVPLQCAYGEAASVSR